MRPYRAVIPLIIVALLLAALPVAAQEWEGSAVLAVRVSNKDGDAIADAQVVARLSEGDPNSGPAPVQTGAGGEALVSGLAEGEWFVEISHSGYMLYAAYVDLRAGKKPQVGFSSQVNTEESFTPMTVKFLKASPTFNRSAGQTKKKRKAPEVVRETPAPQRSEPPTVVRPQPEAPKPAPPEVVRPPEVAAAPVAKEPTTEEAPADEPVVVESPEEDDPVTPANPITPAKPIEAPAVPLDEPQAEAPSQPAEAPSQPAVETPSPSVPAPTSPPAVEELPAAAEELALAPEPDESDRTPTQIPATLDPEPAVEALPPAAAAAPAEVPEPPVPAPDPPISDPPKTEAPSASTSAMETEAPSPSEATIATSGERVAAPPAPETGADSTPSTPVTSTPVTSTPDTSSTAGRIPRYLRSAAAGSCSECQVGEWAVAAEQVAARSGDGLQYRECSGSFEDDARRGAQMLADAPASRLNGYAGPILTALFRIAPGDQRSQIQSLLSPLTEPESYCQMAGIVLPRSAAFSGYVLEAWDTLGGRSCRADVSCAVGQARWLTEPIIVEGTERIVVYDIFKNRSSRRERRARMTIYFQPPTTDWSPGR